jgi:hypothetical protein
VFARSSNNLCNIFICSLHLRHGPAIVANPFIVDYFVRFIANVENTTAAIARRIVAIHWIMVFHNYTVAPL